MSEEFEIKKISQETLGEYLYSVREQLGLAISEVAKKTGILEKFVKALEEGKYQVLPPDAYVLGFLRKLARVYCVSCDDLIEQYKKEKGIVEQTARARIAPAEGWRAYLAQVSVTPKLISLSAGILLGAGAFVYVLAQVFSVNRAPTLTITEPSANTVLAGSSIDFKGQTEPGMSLTVNGQNVMVQADGNFSTTLGVAPGQKDFEVVATNKFGKETTETLSLRVDEPQVAGEVTTEPSDIVLDLEFGRAATIMIVRDGIDLPEETIPAGATKKVLAKEKIELTTSDAGNTKVSLNGKQLGTLGKVGQKLTVPFTNQDLLSE
jgi:cytoskeletal protein RodZ